MLVSGIGLLAVSLAYTEALGRWGSPEVVDAVERSTRDLAHLIGAVPRPVEVLLGIPALAWGVSTRARRRQGWWGTGFGAAGLAVVATSLLDPDVSLVEAGLATAYSLVVGLVLGYLVVRADSFLSGARGRRARRLEEASAHRPEPGRTHPLL
jgi:peptidoglycan/LPS O-acetylase OafA/YrhL